MAVARPEKLKLGNHDYTIEWGYIPFDCEFLYGRTNPRLTLMEINDGVAKSQQRDTLLHEILHAVITETHLTFDGNAEEEIIRVVTPLLLGVLRENPGVVKWLSEGVRRG